MRLPVFGGISGSKTTMWNIARWLVLQLECDADTAEAIVAVALEVTAADRVDRRSVERRVTAGAHDFGVRRIAAVGGNPVAHDRISLDTLPFGGDRIELLRIDGAFELRATLAGRGVLDKLWNDLAVHGDRAFVLRLVYVAQDQAPRHLGTDEHFARKCVYRLRHEVLGAQLRVARLDSCPRDSKRTRGGSRLSRPKIPSPWTTWRSGRRARTPAAAAA